MPSFLGRLRIRRNSAPGSSTSPQSAVEGDAKSNEVGVSPTSPATSGRFRSWFSLKRSRKEHVEHEDYDQPAPRPPTATPYSFLLSSHSAKEAHWRPRLIKRIRPPTMDSDEPSKEDKGKQKQREDVTCDEDVKAKDREEETEEHDEVENDEYDLTEEERAHLASYANGVKGLMAQLMIADKESRRTPPMTNSQGTPLTPISEADEPEGDHDRKSELPLDADSSTEVGSMEPQLVPVPEAPVLHHPFPRAPSISTVVTDLDYGELLDPADYAFGQGQDVEPGVDEDEEETEPRWNSDVAEMMQLESGGRDRPEEQHDDVSYGLPTPATAVSHLAELNSDDGEGRVDDITAERALALDGELDLGNGNADAEKVQTDTETESDSVYFSAASMQDEGAEADAVHMPSIGLRLRGLEVETASSGTGSSRLSSSDEDERTVEDDTINVNGAKRPGTVTPSLEISEPRRHLQSQPHLMFHPDTIDGTASLHPEMMRAERVRAKTLPAGGCGRERVLPALPRVAIPGVDNVPLVVGVGSPTSGELMRTVSQLQREKSRLEQELAEANKRLEQQDGYITLLKSQIDKLHSMMVRFVQKEFQDSLTSATNADDYSMDDIPVVVIAPSPQSDAHSQAVIDLSLNAEPGAGPGPSTLAAMAAAAAKDSRGVLSTPPATPDRRAAIALALSKDGQARQNEDTSSMSDEEGLEGTPKAKLVLMRRKSAGAASALIELGYGRAQVKRRSGSEDLKRLTAPLPWS